MNNQPTNAGIVALAILLCMIAMPALAGSTGLAWQKSLGGSGEDNAFSIQPTDDGGYIVVGDTTSTDGDITVSYGMRDVWVAKLDASGAKKWQKTIGGSMDDHVSCIERLSDGTLLLSGFTWSQDGDFSDNRNPYAIWNMQIDQVGNILWKRCYPGRSASFVVDGKETPDGGMIMIGQSYYDPASPDYHGGYDVLVVKSDMNGTITWEKLLGGTGEDFGDNILPVPGGGYIAIGYTNSNDEDVSGNHGSYDAWLFRLDDAGTLLWQKCLGGSLYDEGREIVVTPKGEYAVMGFTNSNDGDISGNHGSFDYWWATVSQNGTVLARKCFGGSDYDNAYDLEITPDGTYVAFGVSYSKDGDVTGNHGDGDYWAVKFDDAGQVLWQNSFGGSGLDQGQSIKPGLTGDGAFSLVGYSASNNGDVTGNHGLADFWVVKLDVPVGLRANFTVGPTSGYAPLTVQCTDKSIGNPTRINYNFGDSINIAGPDPVHTYRYPGTYTITQSITKYNAKTNSIMNSSMTKTNVITVDEVPSILLVAKFTAAPVNGTAPLEVGFSDLSTGNPTSLNYDFGDGINATAPNPVHTYRYPGNYTVTLTVMKYDAANGTMAGNSSVQKNLVVVQG